ncbi:hypothetical protein [Methanococcoides burtonii]|uniref:Uncharacterized protein n=1 Tax=Methanococcoides burtonii (strain DSM 6242 / NBRC 107633 / OCM 468 / ACE-M) TaxID=259564 RepID=Q12WU6_METBU|nr:hypothetical protein [Methanococcoides burtonii]ABE52080.1 Hypothetical protein Mbur_1157 [Methanococcoides burtonii DSM 6242]
MDENQNQIYVLASPCEQGKTTTALLLEKEFKSKGLKVACLQTMKGQYDVGTFLQNGCYHYTLPLEAAKSKEALEQWIPEGYDRYILEVTLPHGPIGATYIDLFHNINEVVSYEVKDNWKKFVLGISPTFSEFWDQINEKNVQNIITKVPSKIDFPCVDTSFNLHHAEEIVFDTINPKMTFPKSDKKVIAVGAFPAEFWDIFPNLKWYGYEYLKFMKDYRKEKYDLAIVGSCLDESLKLLYKPAKTPVICYQPSCYLETAPKSCEDPHTSARMKSNPHNIYLKIKKEPVGTPIGEEGCLYEVYNNKFWTPDCDIWWENRNHPILSKEDNMIFCNGWILPQYLIKEGYLEV